MNYDHSIADKRVRVDFRLHEAMALGVLASKMPPDTNLDDGGYWWGESVDLAILRVAESVAKALGDKELLLETGAARARLAQKP